MKSVVAPSLSPVGQDLDQLCVNAIRTLSMDAVQAANSGHPGTPMAMAPVAYCLWQQFLRFDPQDPVWHGHNLCIETFGASAPLKQLLKKFGFTVERVVAAAKSQIALHQNLR